MKRSFRKTLVDFLNLSKHIYLTERFRLQNERVLTALGGDEYSEREIIKRSGILQPLLRPILLRMEGEDLILSRVTGSRRLYRAIGPTGPWG